LTDSLHALSPASPSHSPGSKPPPRPKAGPNRPPPPRPAPPAVTPGTDAEVMESCLGVPGSDPMERCPSASSLAAHARSQESLVSGVDDVISSQPYVTDPNEAWGDEPRSRQGPVTDLNEAWGDHPHSRHGPVSGDVISRDPFGALSQPFANGDDFAAKESSTKDPFEGTGWGSESDSASNPFNGVVQNSPSSREVAPPPPARAPVTAVTSHKSPSPAPPPSFAPPTLSSSRPPPSAPPPSRPPAVPPPAVPTRTTPTHGPSVPKRPDVGDAPSVPPRGRGGAPPPVPGRSAPQSGPPPVPARGVKK